MTEERIQKALARTGILSRRQVEKYIEAGRIRVNGIAIELGHKVAPGDVVQIDQRKITIPPLVTADRQVLLYHKPEGEVCTQRDEHDRQTVFASLPDCTEGRWISVGRLDVNSSGLLLFTNDGKFANQLMHPSNEIEREYAVRVFGEVTETMLEQLRTGIMLEDGLAHFQQIRAGEGKGINRWYHVILKEGRKREVRRLWEAVGCRVSRLIRTRYGCISLPRSLPPGQHQYLSPEQISKLLKLCKNAEV